MKPSLVIEKKTNVAVVGTSGHASAELLTLLAEHTDVEITALVTGNEQAIGKPIGEVRTELKNLFNLRCEKLRPEEIAERCDIAILTTNPRESLQYVPGILKGDAKCIDMSGAYRLHDPSVFQKYYDLEHTDPQNLEHAVYGLPELFRRKIRKAALVANPGCYATAALLAIAPVINAIDNGAPITINGISGFSGAGTTYEPQSGIRAYKVGKHQHEPEIAQVIGDINFERYQRLWKNCISSIPTQDAAQSASVSFTPRINDDHARGLEIDVVMKTAKSDSQEDLWKLYRSHFRKEPFVKVIDTIPDVRNVRHKNICEMNVWFEEGFCWGKTWGKETPFRAVRYQAAHVIATIDNLRKGAASQAIQNLNLMCGFEETAGLL